MPLLIQRKGRPPLPASIWSPEMDGEEENVGPFRRTSARTRRMATRMASALASSDNRAQVKSGLESRLLLPPSSSYSNQTVSLSFMKLFPFLFFCQL